MLCGVPLGLCPVFYRAHPSPFFFCSRCWNRDVERKKEKEKAPLVLLRHVTTKCFVKLHGFLISGMPEQVQRKLAIFKN